MLRLKVSYENPKELVDFVSTMGNRVVRLKCAKEQKGRYKRAYIDLKCKLEPEKNLNSELVKT